MRPRTYLISLQRAILSAVSLFWIFIAIIDLIVNPNFFESSCICILLFGSILALLGALWGVPKLYVSSLGLFALCLFAVPTALGHRAFVVDMMVPSTSRVHFSESSTTPKYMFVMWSKVPQATTSTSTDDENGSTTSNEKDKVSSILSRLRTEFGEDSNTYDHKAGRLTSKAGRLTSKVGRLTSDNTSTVYNKLVSGLAKGLSGNGNVIDTNHQGVSSQSDAQTEFASVENTYIGDRSRSGARQELQRQEETRRRRRRYYRRSHQSPGPEVENENLSTEEGEENGNFTSTGALSVVQAEETPNVTKSDGTTSENVIKSDSKSNTTGDIATSSSKSPSEERLKLPTLPPTLPPILAPWRSWSVFQLIAATTLLLIALFSFMFVRSCFVVFTEYLSYEIESSRPGGPHYDDGQYNLLLFNWDDFSTAALLGSPDDDTGYFNFAATYKYLQDTVYHTLYDDDPVPQATGLGGIHLPSGRRLSGCSIAGGGYGSKYGSKEALRYGSKDPRFPTTRGLAPPGMRSPGRLSVGSSSPIKELERRRIAAGYPRDFQGYIPPTLAEIQVTSRDERLHEQLQQGAGSPNGGYHPNLSSVRAIRSDSIHTVRSDQYNSGDEHLPELRIDTDSDQGTIPDNNEQGRLSYMKSMGTIIQNGVLGIRNSAIGSKDSLLGGKDSRDGAKDGASSPSEKNLSGGFEYEKAKQVNLHATNESFESYNDYVDSVNKLFENGIVRPVGLGEPLLNRLGISNSVGATLGDGIDGPEISPFVSPTHSQQHSGASINPLSRAVSIIPLSRTNSPRESAAENLPINVQPRKESYESVKSMKTSSERSKASEVSKVSGASKITIDIVPPPDTGTAMRNQQSPTLFSTTDNNEVDGTTRKPRKRTTSIEKPKKTNSSGKADQGMSKTDFSQGSLEGSKLSRNRKHSSPRTKNGDQHIENLEEYQSNNVGSNQKKFEEKDIDLLPPFPPSDGIGSERIWESWPSVFRQQKDDEEFYYSLNNEEKKALDGFKKLLEPYRDTLWSWLLENNNSYYRFSADKTIELLQARSFENGKKGIKIFESKKGIKPEVKKQGWKESKLWLESVAKDSSYTPHFLTTRTLIRFLTSSALDPEKAFHLLETHLKMSRKLELNKVSDAQVWENYNKGFCVLSGRDNEGKPMIWIKYKFINPGKIKIPVGVKSTWLSIDAALQDIESMRRGVRLVYDFNGIALYNVAAAQNVFAFKDAVAAVAFCHPSVIKSVVFLDAPQILLHFWNLGQIIVPRKLKDAVTFVDTQKYGLETPPGEPAWYQQICEKSQLPRYLGGTHVPIGDFHSYLVHRVKDDSLLY